ncbi:MAG: FadR/GntR family transcriptional regulator, partial [Desulfobacterales bacterium]|nr:FadR/GntR family transcriptional regulator [Desulfobacterales bacterium]MDX2510080.1 FadR/GntR family transcriptional regulator [Desulfobacterales bacterium]
MIKPRDSLSGNLQAVTKTKFHEQIVDQVQALIGKGRLKHGDRLPPERELASIFKVSRHSVREAIRVLEQKKVLKSRPGSGTFIILENESSVVESLANAILREKNTLSEIFQFRKLLEPQIAGLAARNAKKKDIMVLEDLLEQQQKELGNTLVSKELDEKFHLTLAKATGNSVLLQVVELFGHILLKSRHKNSQSPHRNKLSVKGHKKILNAIKDGDSKAANNLMAGHLKAIRELVISTNNPNPDK